MYYLLYVIVIRGIFIDNICFIDEYIVSNFVLDYVIKILILILKGKIGKL